MNKSFKVVFNKARGALMVVNEVTSSVQAKGTKTVIAAAVAALAAGGVAAAEWVKAPEDLGSVSATQKWEDVKDQNSFVHEGKGPAYFLRAEETKTFDKTLWVSGEGEKSQATGLYVTGEDVKLTNEGTIYVSSGEKGKSWQNRRSRSVISVDRALNAPKCSLSGSGAASCRRAAAAFSIRSSRSVASR